MDTTGIARRRILKAAGATLAGAAIGGSPLQASAAMQKLKLTLPWLPDSLYSYAFVAKNQGFWSKRGFDVDVARGNGSITAGQAVAAGQFDFGLIGTAPLILLNARGVNLVSIAAIDYNATMAVALLEDSPIRKPKDLEGKTVGQTGASSDAAFFPIFCQRAGVDLSKVNVVNIDANLRTRTLWEKKVDAITGQANSILPASVAAGKATRYMLYDDYGIKLYADTLVVRPEYLEKNRDTCAAVAAGILEGVAYQLTRPEDTLKIYLKEVKEMAMSQSADEFARVGIEIFQFSMLSEPGAAEHGLGWTDPVKLNQMTDLVMTYLMPAGSPRPDPERIFRRDFAGTIKPTAAQWQAAEQHIQKLSTILRSSPPTGRT
jgi:ABC-type nitrate/sulfonate/bicarbonate transport system substrate-binding protein